MPVAIPVAIPVIIPVLILHLHPSFTSSDIYNTHNKISSTGTARDSGTQPTTDTDIIISTKTNSKTNYKYNS